MRNLILMADIALIMALGLSALSFGRKTKRVERDYYQEMLIYKRNLEATYELITDNKELEELIWQEIKFYERKINFYLASMKKETKATTQKSLSEGKPSLSIIRKIKEAVKWKPAKAVNITISK